MLFYDYILSEHDASPDNARAAACGIDWQNVETTTQPTPRHSRYVESMNGVGIYYDYATDTYFFTDETDEEGQ